MSVMLAYVDWMDSIMSQSFFNVAFAYGSTYFLWRCFREVIAGE
jgi:hypothetical protein